MTRFVSVAEMARKLRIFVDAVGSLAYGYWNLAVATLGAAYCIHGAE